MFGAMAVVGFVAWFIYYKDQKDQQVIDGLKSAGKAKQPAVTYNVGRDDDQYSLTTRPELESGTMLTPASGANSAFSTVMGLA